MDNPVFSRKVRLAWSYGWTKIVDSTRENNKKRWNRRLLLIQMTLEEGEREVNEEYRRGSIAESKARAALSCLQLFYLLIWIHFWKFIKLHAYNMRFFLYQFSSVQSLSHVWLFATPWTAGHQASLSITNSWSLLKLMSIQFYRHTLFYSSIQPLMGIWIISTFWSLRIMLLWTFFYR